MTHCKVTKITIKKIIYFLILTFIIMSALSNNQFDSLFIS